MFHVQNTGQNQSPLKMHQSSNIWKQHQHIGWGIHVLRCIKLHIGLIVGNSEEKETASIPRHRWENNIKLHLKEIGWEGMDWMILPHDIDKLRAVVNTAMDLWVHKVWKFLDCSRNC